METREQREKHFKDMIRNILTKEEFNKYLLDTIDIGDFVKDRITSFINMSDEEQIEGIKQIKSYEE